MVEKVSQSNATPDWLSQLYAPVRQFGERIAEFLAPASEASVKPDYYEIAIELPGVKEDDISVELHDSTLTVLGEKRSTREEKDRNYFFSERQYGSYRRVFRLPPDADANKVTAHHENGVLTVMIAKLSPETSNPKRIKVQRR
ncbi:MAG: Hsp20/alpha crystallin family protein [Nisaea sp.]|jgi:HSP20 family protein|uniref:Hsp20/alpha crystallin family protein n=1 Tax=Nisaea sp. TaxID=2024842 RepID=UPI001B1908BB|nr:Hsp20/alpha crystallin family protein [Nisaea sp.]MBO6562913.1 Hsp20/alpha crystallin family protein [Nisaea sp.]